MAIRTILRYPDPRLRRKAKPVQRVDDGVRALLDDLADTMYQAPGIGLAATQIDVLQRVIVIDISEKRDELQVFINPQILSKEGAQTLEEGCLSVPEIYDNVTRAERVRVRALGRDGRAFELEAHGLLATCIQHEIDHLEGTLFIDHLSRLKQQRIRKKAEKHERLAM